MYNEQVRDLMSPGGPLALRVDANGNAVVAGLSVHKVTKSSLHSNLYMLVLTALIVVIITAADFCGRFFCNTFIPYFWTVFLRERLDGLYRG